MCLVSVAFFASCTPEGNPSIRVLNEEGCVQNGDTVNINTEFDFGFVMASSIETGKQLSTLTIQIDNGVADTLPITGTSFTYRGTLKYEFDRDEIIAESVITAVVTDIAGKTATTSITLKVNNPDIPLLETPITWKREGPTNINAEEMESVGLLWTGSYKEVYATLKPAPAAKLYVCNGDDYDVLETVDQKASYVAGLIETAEPVESYRNITTNNSADYDDMLVTLFDGNAYLIHITHAEIEPITNSNGQYLRTDITITGARK